MLAEIGVVMREDGNTVGVFSPKKVTIHTNFTNFDAIDRFTNLIKFMDVSSLGTW